MVVGFFSDDASALYASLLTSCGLACVDRCLTVIDAAATGKAEGAALGGDAVDALSAARVGERGDAVLVAPLATLRGNADIRDLLDVAVVCGGDPVQARRAVRFASYEAREPRTSATGRASATGPAPGTAWLLPFGEARSRPDGAPADARGGYPSGPAMRTLPVRVPLHGRPVGLAMGLGLPTLQALRIGILLAATLEAAVAVPDAARLDAATMADLMDVAAPPADRAVALRLSALADRLAEIEQALGAQAAAASPGQPGLASGWTPPRTGRVAVASPRTTGKGTARERRRKPSDGSHVSARMPLRHDEIGAGTDGGPGQACGGRVPGVGRRLGTGW